MNKNKFNYMPLDIYNREPQSLKNNLSISSVITQREHDLFKCGIGMIEIGRDGIRYVPPSEYMAYKIEDLPEDIIKDIEEDN